MSAASFPNGVDVASLKIGGAAVDVTGSELSYVSGVTSAVQDQLDAIPSDTATYTNKTIDADNNTITNLENDNIKAGAGIDATKLADGSVTNTELQYLGTVTSNVQDQIDGLPSATATYTNKTLDADNNTITNLEDDNIKAGAAIDAAKIGSGDVSNAEFGYLNGVTSAIQTQLDVKLESDVTSLTSLGAVGTQTQDLNMGSNKIVSLGVPSSANDATTKGYVDVAISTAVGSIHRKRPAETVVTADLGATYDNGALTLTAGSNGAFAAANGVTATDGQYVLVTGQDDAWTNGLYQLTTEGDAGTPWVLTRSDDVASTAEFEGALVLVLGGTYADTEWRAAVPAAFVMDDEGGDGDVTFAQFQTNIVEAGTALAKSGTTLAVDVDDATEVAAALVDDDTVLVYDDSAGATRKALLSRLPTYLNDHANLTSLNALATVGIIGTGVWQGTAIADAYLGTGINADKISGGDVSNTEFDYLNGATSNIQAQLDGIPSAAVTLTNKTFDADGTGNVLSNIDNANIKAGAAIDATKISSGDVTDVEFDYLNGVTSAIQTQLDAKLESDVTSLTSLGAVGTQTQDLNMGSNKIVGVAAPTADTDAANKVYVDNAVGSIHRKRPAETVVTADLGATYDNGALTLTAGSNGAFAAANGVTATDGQYVLVTSQNDAWTNGLYQLTTEGDAGTPWVLTRSDDVASTAEFEGALVLVLGGTYADTEWRAAVPAAFVMDDEGGDGDVTFAQFQTNIVAAGTGLAKSGTTLEVDVNQPADISAALADGDQVLVYDATATATFKANVSRLPTYLNDHANLTSLNALATVGTIGTGVWQGTAIADAYLGTGINADKIADGSVSNAEFQYLNGVTSAIQTQMDTKLTAASTHTLTNKTFDADGTGNSLTNVEDANIKAGAAINAAKIGSGDVSNTEFDYLNGVTDPIQTQLDTKIGSTLAANLNVNSFQVINLVDPSSDQDAATKAYVDAQVDNAVGSIQRKRGADAVAVAPIAAPSSYAAGVLTADANGAFPAVDGVTLTAGKYVLLTAQVSALENGLYEVTTVGDAGTPWELTRSDDMNTDAEFDGALVLVMGGSTYTDTEWRVAVASDFEVGTDNVTVAQFQTNIVTAGTALAKTGTTLDVDVSDATEVAAALADADTVLVYDDSASATRKALLSRLPTYLNDHVNLTSLNALATVGTIGTGVWQGTAIANAYLDTGINADKIADGSVSNAEFQYLNGVTSAIQTQMDTKLTAASTHTLTNKTFDADGTGNSLTNVEDANIKAGAAIDAAKIADGTVSNAEFQYLGGVTSDVQTQLDGKFSDAAPLTIGANATGGASTWRRMERFSVIVDLQGLKADAQDTLVAVDGATANTEVAYLDAAELGTITEFRVRCLEIPSGGAQIKFVVSATEQNEGDDLSGATSLVEPGGAWTADQVVTTTDPTILSTAADMYVYMCCDNVVTNINFGQGQYLVEVVCTGA